MKYTPAANGNGSPYTSFTFQVRDNVVSQAEDGIRSLIVMEFRRVLFRSEPVGANNAVTTAEDTTYTFVAADFPFSDPNDSPANGLEIGRAHVWTPVTIRARMPASAWKKAGDFVSKADIDAGKLKYTPAANGHGSPYTNFTFQVRDNGGTPGQPLYQSFFF